MSDDEETPSRNSGSSRRSRASRRKNRLSSVIKDQTPNVPVLSSEYLFRYSSKNDLVKRLRNIVEGLSDEDVEVDSPEYPGLARLASDIVKDRFLKHKDKEVRLYTVLACMEVFRVYVPEPPYDETEVLKIFTQVIQQLANLSTCTSPKQSNFTQYLKLLQRLANFKIGVVLVEMTKTLDLESEYSNEITDGNDSDDHHHRSRDRDSPSSQEAMEILRELMEVLLNNIQIDHPNEVKSLAVSAISGCIEEFYGTVPIPILDEILKCVGAGPVIYVTNPAFVEASAALAAVKKRDGSSSGKKKVKEKLPPMQIQQTNQSYMVACSVIKKTLDKSSTPIASLLNGLLNGDTNVMKYSNIASSDEPVVAEKGTIIAAAGCISEREQPNVDVWSIVYELHKVAPQILTTVIGTVASSLQSPDDDKRLRVTKLLGRLFYSRTSDIGVNFHVCYKDWIRRSMDVNEKIREIMVKCLLEILRNKRNAENLCEEATDALVKMITTDPSIDVRISSIHKVCDLVYSADEVRSSSSSGSSGGKYASMSVKPMISVPLLKAVGNRISSKNKKERLDSITGLAKIYHRQFMLKKLQFVQEGGDDCNIDLVLETIKNNCDMNIYKITKKTQRGKGKNISSPMRSPIRYSYGIDDDEIDEKYKFIAPKIFDSAFFTDKIDPVMRNRVMMIVDDVILGTGTAAVKDGHAPNNKQILTTTSRALGLTIIMNHLLTNSNDDNETKSVDNSSSYKWMCSLLVQRAKLQQALKAYIDSKSRAEKFPNGSVERSNANAEALEKLKQVASFASPPSANSSPGGVSDGLETILANVHNARDKHIFRLLASISSPTHSMAARSRALDDLPKRTKSLGSSTASWVKSMARRCAMGHFVNVDTITHCILLAQEALHERDFKVCMAFLECVKVAVNIYPTLGGTEEGFETLVELFGECRTLEGHEAVDAKEIGLLTTLSGILATVTPSRKSPLKNDSKDSPAREDDLKSELYNLCTKDGTPEQARHAVFTMAALVNNNSDNNLHEQQKAFAPLLKSLTSPSSLLLSIDRKKNEKVISVLMTLTALVESAPALFMSTEKNDQGRKAICFALNSVLLGRGNDETGRDDSSLKNDGEDVKVTGSARRKSRKRKDADSKDTLSIPCRRAIAAIDFLVSHIRFTILHSRKLHTKDDKSKLSLPSREHISAVFDVLVNLIQDDGYLPSNKDRQECKVYHERASIRKSAAVSLLRLCDGSLNIENKFFSPKYWHIFSKAFVDDDLQVRDSVMNELSMMLIGEGQYRQGSLGFLPSLRFLACVVLCPDNDNHNSISGTAKVGRRALTAKEAALKCVVSLRHTSEETFLRCRAISKKAEENFEKNLKMKLMPEFTVPYAFHLLSFRPETPSGDFIRRGSADHDDNNEINIEDSSQKLLKKRLRWLLEPLVQSLGDGADNISFLLRLTELLGQRYRPIDVIYSAPMESPGSPFSDISLGEIENVENDELSHAKLKVVCAEAREILLKFVKKDSNLNPYPGVIQIPSFLYARSKQTRSHDHVSRTSDSVPTEKSIQNSRKRRKTQRKSTDKAVNSEVTDISLNLSPIPQSRSPHWNLKSVDADETMETPETPVSKSPSIQQTIGAKDSQAKNAKNIRKNAKATRPTRKSSRLDHTETLATPVSKSSSLNGKTETTRSDIKKDQTTRPSRKSRGLDDTMQTPEPKTSHVQTIGIPQDGEGKEMKSSARKAKPTRPIRKSPRLSRG